MDDDKGRPNDKEHRADVKEDSAENAEGKSISMRGYGLDEEGRLIKIKDCADDEEGRCKTEKGKACFYKGVLIMEKGG